MGRDASASHPLLHRLGQFAHQTKATRHPARAPRETQRKFFRAHPACVQCPQQPCLLDRGFSLVRALRVKQKQGFRLAQVPQRRSHRVLSELPQGAHALEPVDDQIPPWIRAGYHHDRDLLADLRQRAQQPALFLGPAHAQRLVAQIELVELQLQAPSVVVTGRVWIRLDLGLTRPRGLLLAISAWLQRFLPDLVFHHRPDYFRREPNPVSGLHPDLVLREIPG